MRKIQRPACPNTTALQTDYKHNQNKKALVGASHGKCMYCESAVTQVYFGDIETNMINGITFYLLIFL